MTTDPIPLQERIKRALWEALPDVPEEDYGSVEPWLDRDAEAIIPLIRKAQVEALRETRNAFYREYQDDPPLLDDGRNPTPDERVGARHAVNVAMAFIVEQMDKIEDGEYDSIVFPQNTTKEEDPR